MARDYVTDERKRENKSEKKRTDYILALSLFAAIYFMIHARARVNSDRAIHRRARSSVLYVRPSGKM